MPGDWYRAIRRWRALNRAAKTVVGDRPAPDANEEYLLYQTLVGTWPLFPMNSAEHQAYVRRIDEYMQKALHEAKVHTSWINANSGYEQAVAEFVERVLEPSPENRFLQEFRQFQAPIARAGMWNSIAQVLLKIASPGVPDFYQGNEIWAFDLVDPDNRRAVNYEVRGKMLASLRAQAGCKAALMDRLRENPCDGAIKMFVTSEALRFRRDHPELFLQASYTGLVPEGSRARHVVAFARESENQMMVALTGRFFLKLCNSHGKPIGDVWGNSTVALPRKVSHASFQDILTGQTVTAQRSDDRLVLPLNKVFSHCPVALLFAETNH